MTRIKDLLIMKIKNILAMTILTSCWSMDNCLGSQGQQIDQQLNIDIAKICIPQNTQEVQNFISLEKGEKTIGLWKVFPYIRELAERVEDKFNERFIALMKEDKLFQSTPLLSNPRAIECNLINTNGKICIEYPDEGCIIHAVLGHDETFYKSYRFVDKELEDKFEENSRSDILGLCPISIDILSNTDKRINRVINIGIALCKSLCGALQISGNDLKYCECKTCETNVAIKNEDDITDCFSKRENVKVVFQGQNSGYTVYAKMSPGYYVQFSTLFNKDKQTKLPENKSITASTIEIIKDSVYKSPTNNPWLFGLCGSRVNVLDMGYNITSDDIINMFTNENNKIRIKQVEINTEKLDTCKYETSEPFSVDRKTFNFVFDIQSQTIKMEEGDGNWQSAKGGKKQKYKIMNSSNFMRTQYAISKYHEYPIVIFNTLLDEYSDQKIDFVLPSGIQKYLSNLLIKEVFDRKIDLELPYLDASLFSINQTQLKGLFRKKGVASCKGKKFPALEHCQQTIKKESNISLQRVDGITLPESVQDINLSRSEVGSISSVQEVQIIHQLTINAGGNVSINCQSSTTSKAPNQNKKSTSKKSNTKKQAKKK